MKKTVLLTTLSFLISITATANVAANSLHTSKVDDGCHSVKTLAKSTIIQQQLGFDKQKVLEFAKRNSSDVDSALAISIVDKAFEQPYIADPEKKETVIVGFESEINGLCLSK